MQLLSLAMVTFLTGLSLVSLSTGFCLRSAQLMTNTIDYLLPHDQGVEVQSGPRPTRRSKDKMERTQSDWRYT